MDLNMLGRFLERSAKTVVSAWRSWKRTSTVGIMRPALQSIPAIVWQFPIIWTAQSSLYISRAFNEEVKGWLHQLQRCASATMPKWTSLKKTPGKCVWKIKWAGSFGEVEIEVELRSKLAAWGLKECMRACLFMRSLILFSTASPSWRTSNDLRIPSFIFFLLSPFAEFKTDASPCKRTSSQGHTAAADGSHYMCM